MVMIHFLLKDKYGERVIQKVTLFALELAESVKKDTIPLIIFYPKWAFLPDCRIKRTPMCSSVQLCGD